MNPIFFTKESPPEDRWVATDFFLGPRCAIWVFPKIGIPQNGWFTMENPIKMDDLGVPLFSETPIYIGNARRACWKCTYNRPCWYQKK